MTNNPNMQIGGDASAWMLKKAENAGDYAILTTHPADFGFLYRVGEKAGATIHRGRETVAFPNGARFLLFTIEDEHRLRGYWFRAAHAPISISRYPRTSAYLDMAVRG